MRALIVATSKTTMDAVTEIRVGRHPHIDYLSLARQFAVDYLDYNVVPDHPAIVKQWETVLRLDLRQALHVARLVDQHGYDLVFSMSERVGIPLALLLPSGVRHVMIGHHLLSPWKLRVLKGMNLAERWSGILVPTHAERDALQRTLTLSEERVGWLPNSVDADFFQPDLGGDTTVQQGFVLSVGLSYRDYPTLVAALRMLPSVPAQLYIGSTWYSDATTIGGAPLPNNIQLHSFVPMHLLRAWYYASRFVVVPIRRTALWSAGSTVILQAQAMGKPVIATRTPGMSDYVVDGVTGLLVDPENPEALADAIKTLWNDPARVRAMGGAARAWVAATFSLDRWLARAGPLLSGDVRYKQAVEARISAPLR